MDLDDLELAVREFVAREARMDPAEIGPTTALVDAGLFDSITIVRVTALIEREVGITIPDRDVTEENFGSLASIRAYVERRSAGA